MKELSEKLYRKIKICLILTIVNFILVNFVLLSVLGVITIFE